MRAAEHIINNTYKYTRHGLRGVDIISDSRSALQALDKNVVRAVGLKECKLTLDKLQEKLPVTLHWIRAHQGHLGNEEADRAAKKGTELREFEVEPVIPVPRTWTKKKIAQFIHEEWTLKWRGLSEARQMKIFWGEPDWKKSRALLNYDRVDYAEVFRWASGHSFHRYHNFLTRPEKFYSPRCRACGEEKEESSHLYAYCSALGHVRMRTLGVPGYAGGFEWTGRSVLDMARRIGMICPEEMPDDPGDTIMLSHPVELEP
jgi:hypothetical protein